MKKIFSVGALTLLFTIIGVIALTPLWPWRADNSSRSLQVRIASQLSLQPETANSISGLTISIDNHEISSPFLSVLELSNNGDKPILASEFETSFEIHLAGGSSIARAEISEVKPNDIKADWAWKAQEISVKPLLLNPQDAITFLILTSGAKPEFSTRTRIAGISNVPIVVTERAASSKIKIVVFVIAALLLFTIIQIPGNALLSNKPVILRRRAALFISISTCIICGAVLSEIFDVLNIDKMFELVGVIGLAVAASGLAGFLNKEVRLSSGP